MRPTPLSTTEGPTLAFAPLSHLLALPTSRPPLFFCSFALDNVQLGAAATLAWPPVDTFEGGADGWVGTSSKAYVCLPRPSAAMFSALLKEPRA